MRYVHHSGRMGSDNFIGGSDLHEAGSDLAYFVWVARRSDKLFVIDTGFGPQAAAQRRRTLLRPAEALRPMGIEAARVDDVILTHLLPTVASIGRVRHLRRLADTPDHIVPGHDPLVLARYRAPSAGLDGVVVRLDEAPRREEARP